MHSVLQPRSSESTVAWLAEIAVTDAGASARATRVTRRARVLVTDRMRALSAATLSAAKHINVIVTSTRASLRTHDVSVGTFGDCVSHVASMSWCARRAGNASRCVVR
jgi:hypothetical protein